MDSKTLNLDPDPKFWGPDPGLCYQFWKKNLNIILQKKHNFLKHNFFKIIRKYWYWKKILESPVSEWWIYLCIQSYTFCLYFNLYLNVWIQIRIPNTDPQRSWIRI